MLVRHGFATERLFTEISYCLMISTYNYFKCHSQDDALASQSDSPRNNLVSGWEASGISCDCFEKGI